MKLKRNLRLVRTRLRHEHFDGEVLIHHYQASDALSFNERHHSEPSSDVMRCYKLPRLQLVDFDVISPCRAGSVGC